MKTASLARAPPAQDSKGGGASRAPFFSARIQAKAAEEDVQARLRVGRPNDRFELEADRVADKVVDGKAAEPGLAAGITPLAQRSEDASAVPEPEEEVAGGAGESVQAKAATESESEPEEDKTLQAKSADPAPAAPEEKTEDLQTKPLAPAAAATEEKKEELQTKALAPAAAKEEELPAQARAAEGAAPGREKEEEIQPRAGRGGPRSASDAVSRQVRAARGLGSALSEAVRDRMEGAFKADFSGVRIHTDSAAVLLARELNAQAFTVGGDVFFGEGKFAPGSREGEHLLAHELAHTVQQGAVTPDTGASEPDVIRLAPDEQAEDGQVRPELHEAIRLARGEIGKVNAKTAGGDGKRIGWERLRDYFNTAFGGPVVSETVIDRVTMIEKTGPDGKKSRMDALPSWCGIFAWWAMKKAGIPIPDWKLGVSALDAMTLRKGGELPRKGDVAIDVLPNNHFALVTGLESSKDADGNPAKLTRVGTINGNTAGEDNLGGQVQERWDAPARWDHYLDPVGKIAMPPAPAGLAKAAPAEPETEGEKAAAPSAPAKAGPGKEVSPTEAEDAEAALAEDSVAPLEVEQFDSPYPEADLTLPPRPEEGEAEEVAVVETVDMSGSSDQATTAFMDASPSAMAVSQPQFGQTVDAKMKAEQKGLADNPPVLETKTSGAAEVALKGADAIPIPSEAGAGGATGGDLQPIEPVSEDPAEPFRGNAEREKELEQEDSGSFWDRFMNFLKGFTKSIRTRDDSIDTSAGPRKRVDLTGPASPGAITEQREKDAETMKAQRDSHVEAFRNHPGQAKIQPVKVDESVRAPVSDTPVAEVEPQDDPAVAEYAAAPLPADVRKVTDAKLAANMEPKLAENRAQTVEAATARDTDKKREIETAQDDAKKLGTQADSEQRGIVVENRAKVAKLQGDGIGGAYEQVNSFTADATARQGADRKEIREHVKGEEDRAKKELESGEKEAREKKEEGEREAAAHKKKLEEEQAKKSWWDRVKDRVKSAVKFVTGLIDKAINKARSLVKKAINRVKNAAIGFINKARNWVVDRINGFRDWAKNQVNKYLKGAFPGLARRINAGIDAVADGAIKNVNKAADAAIAGVNRLAAALTAALDKILAKFAIFLKTAVRVVGAVMVGDFAGAARAAIEGACEIAEVDPKKVFEFLDRAGKAIASIFSHPIRFIKGLFGGIADGLGAFFGGIKKHLIEGVLTWLTGAMGEIRLTGPFEFSPKGIFQLVLQILRVTPADIKARVIVKLPAAAGVFGIVEEKFDLVKRLFTEGPGALWDEMKSQLGNLQETVMGSIRNWLITTIIKQGIIWLLALTNPASAIVKAIMLLYKLIVWLADNWKRIRDFIVAVYDGVVAAAEGNFSKVATLVETALVKILPALIGLLATILNIEGIANRVKDVIQTVTKPINKAIDWIIDRIVKFARKVVAGIKSGAKKVKEKAKATVEKIVAWWKERRKFKSKDGGPHSIYYKGEAKAADLMVASNEEQLENFLTGKSKNAEATAEQRQVAADGLAQYKLVLESEAEIARLEAKRKATGTADKDAYSAAQQAVKSEITKFRGRLDGLAKILQKATFGDEDDAAVCTYVSHDAGGAKSTAALPLTSLSGNTKGSGPSGKPPGWAHAQALDNPPDGSSPSIWVRGHLLNDNLHGPGTEDNLVPITKTMNSEMEARVESPAKQAIKAKGKLFFYKAIVTFWKQPPPVNDFPETIAVTWGTAKRKEGDKTKFEEDAANPTVTISMGKPPPAVAAAFVPSINNGSPTLLENAINRHGKVTGYFVSQILLANFKEKGAFASKDDMKTRLWQEGTGDDAVTRRNHVQATYTAINAGAVEV